jgi:4'-phosphopantetheinyl transferase
MSVAPAAFLLQRSDDVPEDDWWLTPVERAVVEGLRVPMRRTSWRLGRWTAKGALAVMAASGLADFGNGPEILDRSDIEIRSGEDGAPRAFAWGKPLPVALSISHRAGLAACLVAGPEAAVGCDVELVEGRSEGFLADYFTDREVATVKAAPPSRRALLVVLMWSAKESMLKALHTGLRSDTRSVEVEPDAAQDLGERWQALLVRERASGRRCTGWWRRHASHVLTVVADPPLAAPVDLTLGSREPNRASREGAG